MINVAVLFGGRSVEHDVSIISAVQAMGYFDKTKYNVYPIYITKDNEFYYSDNLKNLKEFNKLDELLKKCQRVVFTKDSGKVQMLTFPSCDGKSNTIANLDVAFPIVHGTNVEDGKLQGFLKTLDIPFTGCDVLSSAVGMDKYVMKILLSSAGFPVLNGAIFSKYQYSVEEVAKKIEKKFSYPVIIKPVNLGSSVGISKANNHEELLISINNAFSFSRKILVEPAITNLKEINCSVLGSPIECRPSICEEPITSHDVLDFEEKYISGSKKTCGSKGMASLKRKIPAEISNEQSQYIQKIACDVFKYLECWGVVRLDFMIDLDTNKIWLNEINTIPGSLSFYLWEPLGIKYSKLLDRIVELAFERDRLEKEVSYVFESSILANMSGK